MECRNEREIQLLHRWVECLCDPDLNLAAEYDESFHR